MACLIYNNYWQNTKMSMVSKSHNLNETGNFVTAAHSSLCNQSSFARWANNVNSRANSKTARAKVTQLSDTFK